MAGIFSGTGIEKMNKYRYQSSRAASSWATVGISVWNQPSEGVGLTRSGEIHRFRQASFTVRELQTAFQCFESEKYVLRFTKALVVLRDEDKSVAFQQPLI
jgi:hypothetical protein